MLDQASGLSERQIGVLLTTMEVMQVDIRHIVECLEGNGKPGLVHEMETYKHRVERLEDQAAERAAREEQQAADRRSIVAPMLVHTLEYALGGGAFVVLGHLMGLMK